MKSSLDDGSRGCSKAFFVEASPPPRRAVATVVASSGPSRGAALPRSSTWAGPQQADRQPPPGAAPPPPPRRPAGARPHSHPEARDCAPSGATTSQRPAPMPYAPPPAVYPTTYGYSSEEPLAPAGGRRRGRRRGAGPAPPADGLEELRGLIQDLRAELRALRRENELLRRAQVLDPWRAAPAPIPYAPSTPLGLTPIPPPHFSPVRPLPGDVDMVPAGLGPRSRDQGATPEAKRSPPVARTLVVDGPNV